MWDGLWEFIWKEGVVVRKVSKWLCLCSLQIAVQWIILYSLASFIVLCFLSIYQLIDIQDGYVDCSKRVYIDLYCSLFKGKVGLFSTVYVSLYFVISASVGFFGIYWWIHRFRLQLIECFFMIYFVTTLFGYVNALCLAFITLNFDYLLVLDLVGTTLLDFYWISIVYSFVLQKDQEYRTQRKRYTDVIAEWEGSDCDNSDDEKSHHKRQLVTEDSNSIIMSQSIES